MTRFSRSERRNPSSSSNDFRKRIRVGSNRARAGHAAERSHAARDSLRFLARQKVALGIDRHDGFAAQHHFPFAREVERHDGNILHVDVQPNIQLRPIRQRKDADAFALIEARIEDVPQLRTLILRIPLSHGIAERVDPLLGARLFFVAARPTECGIESAFGQRVQQRFGL